MQEAISLWPLIGIAVIVVGFVLRFNPVLVVIISGIVTGVAAHMPIATILEKLGEGFLNTRNLPFILLLPLAVIGLLERHGLKERAQAWIAKIHSATAGRLLIVYLFVREATAALGLTSLGGHPQMAYFSGCPGRKRMEAGWLYRPVPPERRRGTSGRKQ